MKARTMAFAFRLVLCGFVVLSLSGLAQADKKRKAKKGPTLKQTLNWLKRNVRLYVRGCGSAAPRPGCATATQADFNALNTRSTSNLAEHVKDQVKRSCVVTMEEAKFDPNYLPRDHRKEVSVIDLGKIKTLLIPQKADSGSFGQIGIVAKGGAKVIRRTRYYNCKTRPLYCKIRAKKRSPDGLGMQTFLSGSVYFHGHAASYRNIVRVINALNRAIQLCQSKEDGLF